MRRYFYTDPLAAAWMAKHFGMQFVENFEINEQYIDGALSRNTVPAKLYIHPDRLHLLDPQVGDLLFRRDYVWEFTGRQGGANSVSSISMIELILSTGGKIIYRNGLAYHWPECEEV